jgi:hypothetical protein
MTAAMSLRARRRQRKVLELARLLAELDGHARERRGWRPRRPARSALALGSTR